MKQPFKSPRKPTCVPASALHWATLPRGTPAPHPTPWLLQVLTQFPHLPGSCEHMTLVDRDPGAAAATSWWAVALPGLAVGPIYTRLSGGSRAAVCPRSPEAL